jgi:hypothetical protein
LNPVKIWVPRSGIIPFAKIFWLEFAAGGENGSSCSARIFNACFECLEFLVGEAWVFAKFLIRWKFAF